MAATPVRTELHPLDGYRVLDFTQNVAGPLAGQVLADLGAEVIKIEPERGEAARHIVSMRSGTHTLAPYFIPNNRGKRSFVADLRTADGVAAVLELVETADVVLDGFRPGTMDAWGIGIEQVRERNSRCIYASLSAYGGNGANGMKPGIDLIVQAESGVLTGLTETDGTPQRIPFQLVDGASGHVLAQAVLAALLHRERHQVTTNVQVAMYDVAVSLQSNRLTDILDPAAGKSVSGAMRFATAPSGIYRGADGYFAMAAYIPKHWTRLAGLLGRTDFLDDPRFTTQQDRARNSGELQEELGRIFEASRVDETVALLSGAGLMACRVHSLSEVVASEVFAENELVITVGDETRRETTVRTPARYSAFGLAAQLPTPVLGEFQPRSGAEQITRS
ncbi:CoA transferase [Rhodococcus qingshengii]|nr:CoA transferase [Rhodococcus qingshengii]QXC46867.1 CoA transferase [Rhodococcus qingshengii]